MPSRPCGHRGGISNERNAAPARQAGHHRAAVDMLNGGMEAGSVFRWCGSVGETAAPHGCDDALPFVAKAVDIYGYCPADSAGPEARLI